MSANFERARELFIEGVRAFEGQHIEQARDCFEASLAIVPGRPSTLVNLAATRIRLDDAEAALPLLAQVLEQEPENLDAWAYRGAALADLERYDEALSCQEHVLAAEPQHRAAAFERAALLNLLGRHGEALRALGELLRHDADHAPSWIEQGHTLHALNRPLEALVSYERALALDKTSAEAWSQYGGVLKDIGRLGDAALAFGQAIALGHDTEIDAFMLASLRADPAQGVPSAPPRAYVQGLFDNYAQGFDAHLQNDLAYRAPEALLALLPPARHYATALDLGCGTGLSALPLQARASAIDGIDLAPRMLARARERGLYRALMCGDITELMAAMTPMSSSTSAHWRPLLRRWPGCSRRAGISPSRSKKARPAWSCAPARATRTLSVMCASLRRPAALTC
jgi:predicted TPR repeat methyltransferase